MQRSLLAICTLAVLVLAAASAPARGQSGAPDLIPFQGYLTDDAGDPLADGTYALTFKLYTVSSGGSATWTEAHTGGNEIQVTDGLFHVLLGSIQSLSGITFEQQLYLGITVESDPEISPRTQLGSVPYALAMRDVYSKSNEVIVSTNLGIGGAPTRELTIDDVDDSGGTIMNLTAANRELLIGVNPSTGALIRGTTDNNLNLGAGGSDHLTVRSDGDIHVHENLLVGTSTYKGRITVLGPDDAATGPIVYMLGNTADQVESGRIRFTEATTSWRGAFIHYDGSANALHIGMHNTSDETPGNDLDAITIGRSSRDVTIHEDLIVNDHSMRATPIAMGVVDASAENFISSTSNVASLFYSDVSEYWSFYLTDSCTSDSQAAQEVVVSITMRETGVDEIIANVDCSNSVDCPNSPSNCVRVEIETNNAFGGQKKDFQFVVHRF